MASANGPSVIPVVDMGVWTAGKADNRHRIARELTEACRRVGFVYITNHGVPEELLEQAFAWSQRLFNLPEEQKKLAPHPPGPDVHRGYSWPGLEKVSQIIFKEGEEEKEAANRTVADVKESYEIGSEDLDLQPNVWLPEEVLPGFRDFMMRFYWTCFGAAQELLRALALGVGLEDEDHLVRYHSGVNNQLRLLHYPPVEAERLASDAAARMPAHSDWGSITLLFQDGCGGLQVEDPHAPGTFVDAVPMPSAMVMNVGDLLMRWSNDYLKSTLHRVTLPPLPTVGEARGERTDMARSRYSIPYFVAPDPTAVVECLPSCADEDNPPRYEPVMQDDYRRMRAKGQYAEPPKVEATAVG